MIRLENITKYYYSQNAVAVGLNKVNLEFSVGEFVAITGESGSGKSTLLNVLAGMIPYEEGELYVDGKATSYFDQKDFDIYRREYIGFIYQSYNLVDSYTALENVEAVLLIGEKEGEERRQQREKAMGYLDLVGLKEVANHKATNLSSGQKQRLGIARALAKETRIIIADEPTGNLDVENGKAIMELLSKLAKDRLVIVVTHNYEQAEPYVTRKVRLFDGEVAEDLVFDETGKPTTYIPKERPKKKEEEVENGLEEKGHPLKKIARQFVHMNHKSQPHRTLFLVLFLFLSCAAYFVFTGSFLGALDDYKVREQSTKLFANVIDTRLEVRNPSGKELSKRDITNINGIKHLDEVDSYDEVSDISYHYRKGKDYEVEYSVKTNAWTSDSVDPKLLDNGLFMRSASCITKDQLLKGRLPKAYNEVVLSKSDLSKYREEIIFYFDKETDWTTGDAYGLTLKVVGITKEDDMQAYFSNQLCQGISVKHEGYDVDVILHETKTVSYEDPNREGYVSDYENKITATVVYNPELEANQVRISNNHFLDLLEKNENGLSSVQAIEDEVTVNYLVGDETKTLEASLAPEGGNFSDNMVEVGKEIYETIYGKESLVQVTAYLDDYCYTNRVLKKLEEKGYEAISVYRVSSGDYNPEKSSNRISTLLISAGALLIIFLLDIIVIYAILKLKKKDILTLRSIGMREETMYRMNRYEMLGLTGRVLLVIFVMAYVLKYAGVSQVSNLVKYYTPGAWVFVVFISLGMALLTNRFFNRYLKKAERALSSNI